MQEDRAYASAAEQTGGRRDDIFALKTTIGKETNIIHEKTKLDILYRHSWSIAYHYQSINSFVYDKLYMENVFFCDRFCVFRFDSKSFKH